eukprot:jgi/Tetstr1/465215/TSEL_009921.t1
MRSPRRDKLLVGFIAAFVALTLLGLHRHTHLHWGFRRRGPIDMVGPGILSEDFTAHHLDAAQIEVPKAERGAWPGSAGREQYNALVRNITSGARGLDEEGMRAHLAAKLPRLIPYKNSFIINTETWSAGDLIKQPKHLSLEGRLNRAARGHADAATRDMKWDHVGMLNASWIKAGLVAEHDELRDKWLSKGPSTASCAIVGNGGGLLLGEAGPLIDRHDIIFRFNGGPVRGFERHVGRRTTIRLANTEHFAFYDVGDEIILQHCTNRFCTGNLSAMADEIMKYKKCLREAGVGSAKSTDPEAGWYSADAAGASRWDDSAELIRDEGSDHSWMPGTWGLGLWRRRLQQEAGAGVAAEVHGGGGGVEEGWAGVAMGEGGGPEEEEEEHEQGKEEAAEEEGRGCRLDPKYMGRVRLVDPQFHYTVMQIFPHGAPSNGFYGSLIANELCHSVTLFGFQKNWRNTRHIPYHYYNNVEPNNAQTTRDMIEKRFYPLWMEKVNEDARGAPAWREWAQEIGWEHDKFVYAEQVYSNLMTLDLPDRPASPPPPPYQEPPPAAPPPPARAGSRRPRRASRAPA